MRQDELSYTEVTPEYERISGEDMIAQKAKDLQAAIDLFDGLDFKPRDLKNMDSFNEVFVATMIIKYHLMVSKQRDYGPGNIAKAGPLGIITRSTDKLERLKQLIGSPEKQVADIRLLIENLPEDATANEVYNVLDDIDVVVNPMNAVAGETVDDTWMDLGNYGDIGYVEHHGGWGKSLR